LLNDLFDGETLADQIAFARRPEAENWIGAQFFAKIIESIEIPIGAALTDQVTC